MASDAPLPDETAPMSLAGFRALAEMLRVEVRRVIQGQDALIEMLLISIFARGHCLLEGPPGTAKTLLAQTLSQVTSLQFGRVQFTPDLMPGDVLGVNLFNFQTGEFRLTRGPVFTDILLADEINRAPQDAIGAFAGDERARGDDRRRHPFAGG
ncbi:hypothetical protein MASR1M32_23120 [Rhodobacter sp.]